MMVGASWLVLTGALESAREAMSTRVGKNSSTSLGKTSLFWRNLEGLTGYLCDPCRRNTACKTYLKALTISRMVTHPA